MKQGRKFRLLQVRRTGMVPGDQFPGHRLDTEFILGLGITNLNGCSTLKLLSLLHPNTGTRERT